MKQIFLLILAAGALANNAQAYVNTDEAKSWGECTAIGYRRTFVYVDPEHIPFGAEMVAELQNKAVLYGAQTPEEIDQFVRIAWFEMYQKLKLLASVEDHKPTQ